jgi:hypothetical protein
MTDLILVLSALALALIITWWLGMPRVKRLPPPAWRYLERGELARLARTGCRKCGSSGLEERPGGVSLCWCVSSRHPLVQAAEDGRPVLYVGPEGIYEGGLPSK